MKPELGTGAAAPCSLDGALFGDQELIGHDVQPPPAGRCPDCGDASLDTAANAGATGPRVPDPAAHHAYVTLLFSRHRASLHRYLCRLVPTEDAAELVQESYYRLLRHGDMVRIDALARSFLFQTATNLARDHHRRRLSHRAAQHVQLDDHELPEDHQGPDLQLAGEQICVLLERAVAELPPQTRMVFRLHRFRDLSYPQIAGVMNLSVRTVARKMAEAVERLAAAVGDAS